MNKKEFSTPGGFLLSFGSGNHDFKKMYPGMERQFYGEVMDERGFCKKKYPSIIKPRQWIKKNAKFYIVVEAYGVHRLLILRAGDVNSKDYQDALNQAQLLADGLAEDKNTYSVAPKVNALFKPSVKANNCVSAVATVLNTLEEEIKSKTSMPPNLDRKLENAGFERYSVSGTDLDFEEIRHETYISMKACYEFLCLEKYLDLDSQKNFQTRIKSAQSYNELSKVLSEFESVCSKNLVPLELDAVKSTIHKCLIKHPHYVNSMQPPNDAQQEEEKIVQDEHDTDDINNSLYSYKM